MKLMKLLAFNFKTSLSKLKLKLFKQFFFMFNQNVQIYIQIDVKKRAIKTIKIDTSSSRIKITQY